jgi:hypothetical protein
VWLEYLLSGAVSKIFSNHNSQSVTCMIYSYIKKSVEGYKLKVEGKKPATQHIQPATKRKTQKMKPSVVVTVNGSKGHGWQFQ